LRRVDTNEAISIFNQTQMGNATVLHTSPTQDIIPGLQQMRRHFDSGATRSYEYRITQLKKFRDAIVQHEQEIYKALYADLKKSPEEAYASELGLLIAELNSTIKKLRTWMRPKAAGTDFVNFPSSSKLYRDPLGVVLIIAPWNYPLQLLLIPLVGAIAGGNCAVLKPSELAGHTASLIGKIITGIFNSEYVSVVQGDGAKVVPAMMNAFRFDHVFYTGSIPVGKSIYQMAARNLVPVTLELGGKSPAVVEADADIKTTARRIVLGKFLNAGQTCIAPDYILVHASVKEKLVGAIKETIKQFYGTDASASNDYGKIINEKRFDKLAEYIGQGNIIMGGKLDKKSLYVEPTLMDNVPLDSPLMTEEIFGPVLPVQTFNNMHEALSIVQHNANPLAFYLFTNSKSKKQEWIDRIAFGGGCINNTAWYFTNHHLPFGGVGNSGMGAYHGRFTFDAFTRVKPVMKTPTWFDPALKYPPFKGKLKILKWFIK
jgi:aldehyde dehydrogenase (NAD+)